MICFCLLSCVLWGGLPALVRGDSWSRNTAQLLYQWLSPQIMGEPAGCSEAQSEMRKALIRFYEQRHYQLAWVDDYGLLPEGDVVLAVVRDSGSYGLKARDYSNPWLEGLLNGLVSVTTVRGPQFMDSHIRLDLLLTEMLLRFVYHSTYGRTDPMMLDYGAAAAPPPSAADLAGDLADALADGRLADYLEGLGPRHPAYHALHRSLQQYLKIRDTGGWPVIDAGPTLKRGDRDIRVALIRYRLAVTGDTQFISGVIDDRFDEDLEGAVQRFQHRHGLHPDGVVGPGTLAALNVPVEARIRQIELNMERWRWMPADLGDFYVMANIPGYELSVVAQDHTVGRMRTIVGRQRRPTPVLASRMTYLELNPYWYVPPTIAREDLLPKIQQDPDFLRQGAFRVFAGWDSDAPEIDPLNVDWSAYNEDHFPFRLRQEPAAHNALGQVKFMFPNELSVYIHDTPGKSLFARTARSFSSGCVRVEDPMKLAAMVLGRQDWDPERLSRVVSSRERQVVILEEPVPVYLVYFTTWVEANGEVHFREDIYGNDRQLLSALSQSMVAGQDCGGTLMYSTYFVQAGPGMSDRHPVSDRAPL